MSLTGRAPSQLLVVSKASCRATKLLMIVVWKRSSAKLAWEEGGSSRSPMPFQDCLGSHGIRHGSCMALCKGHGGASD